MGENNVGLEGHRGRGGGMVKEEEEEEEEEQVKK